jgi:epsilon-lactone hydrolase
MCFSAAASFAGGAVLTAIGVATVHESKESSQRLFAAIPLVFGVQQISEGFIWLALKTPGHDLVAKIAIAVFLFAAVIIWPTMVPLAVLLMEKAKRRRWILYILLGVGLAVSLAHAIGMLIYEVTAQISGYHILYSIKSPPPIGRITTFAYVVATIMPLFVSSKRRMVWFGVVIVMSLAATQIFYTEFLVSVWCFFAALGSAVIWWIVREPAAAHVSFLGRIVSKILALFIKLAGGNIIAVAKKRADRRHNQWNHIWNPPKGFRLEQIKLPNDVFAEYLVPGRDDGSSQPGCAVLYLHGGGYIIPYQGAFRRILVKLARLSGMPVLAVDYRVAPENVYPAALDDAAAAVEWLRSVKGFPASSLIVSGESAGGGLALALAMRLRDEGKGSLRGLVLLSPWTNLTCGAGSYTSRFDQDPIFGHKRVRPVDGNVSAAGSTYAGGYDLKDPYISPAFGDFTALPPMLVHVGECEMLYDDAVAVYDKAKAAGLEIQFKSWPGMFHVFQMADGLVPEAAASWREIGLFVRKLIQPTS